MRVSGPAERDALLATLVERVAQLERANAQLEAYAREQRRELNAVVVGRSLGQIWRALLIVLVFVVGMAAGAALWAWLV